MEHFLELMADAIEMGVDEISMDMDFREEIYEFSSLMGFSMIVMIEDEYGVELTVEQFLNCKTFGDLYAYVK